MSARVLIVDDNDLNLRLFHDLLSSEGYQTLLSHGEGDIPGLVRAARPDLILMDIRLGAGDGLEATRMIKSDRRTVDIPVIAVTACAMKGDEERFRATGCADYIAKPASLKYVLEVIRKHLSRSRHLAEAELMSA